MTIPEGLEHFEDVSEEMCAKLQATIYGLVQAARQFWKKLIRTAVEKMGFTKSRADPCLLMKKHLQSVPVPLEWSCRFLL